MQRSGFLATAAALALSALLGNAARAQTSYSYRDLGTLGGTTATTSYVNNAGQVVGASSLANGATHPFYWSSATGMVDIGTFGGTGGGAKGINNLGDVVGHATNAAATWRPFLWNNATRVLTDLNSLLSPTDASLWTLTYAWKINDNRQVIGQGTIVIGGTPVTHGYLLDLNTNTILDLGAITPDGINNLASPQVSAWQSGNSYLYSGGSLTSLAPLIRATNINNAGETVGYLFNAHPAYRSPSGVVTDLGTFGGAGGGSFALAYSINNAASPMVVGSTTASTRGATIYHAFRWTVGSGAIQDLNALTTGLGKRMVLFGAVSVSDTGYIACQQDPAGSSTASTRAVLLTPQ